jgi:hypothetical protein
MNIVVLGEHDRFFSCAGANFLCLPLSLAKLTNNDEIEQLGEGFVSYVCGGFYRVVAILTFSRLEEVRLCY